MKTCSVDEIERAFPVQERLRVWKKANVMFKTDMDYVVYFLRKYSDPTRGTIIRSNDKYLYVSSTSKNVVHVTDIVRYVVYSERETVRVLDEKKVRLLARGLLFHKLFKKAFAGRVTATYEVPVVCSIGRALLVGTIDLIIYTDSNDTCLVELKSSDTEQTIAFGLLQAKVYWTILRHFTDVNVSRAYVLTPKNTIVVDKPMMKGDLYHLLVAWSGQAEKDI